MGAKAQMRLQQYLIVLQLKLLSMTYAGADYTKVTEAKKRIPSDLTLYTDETVQALEDALKDVKYDLDINTTRYS